MECQLITLSLLERRSSHPYEALSYVWGSENNKKPIYVRGNHSNHELRVTANLYAALSHLRHCVVERLLWVDAVCINQADNDEKGQQVQSMAKIYAKASRVIVWLVDPPKKVTPDKGNPADDGDQAENEDQVDNEDQADSGDRALEAIRAAAEERRVDSTMDQKMILTLLGREWFRRIWVSDRRLIIWQSCH